jgi:cytidylate kinase
MGTGPGIVVLSGLPGSGKTTLGRELADRLGFTFIDKDDILEALLSEHASFDLALRQRLSRESDAIFRDRALAAGNAVLCSFWRPRGSGAAAGTPSDWLPELSEGIVEIHCRCDVDTAVRRFLGRQRHPGHLDSSRSEAALREQFASLRDAWPLRVGKLVEVETTGGADVGEVSRRVSELLAGFR